jgi:dTDP-glucose 4,6-dehydratase
MRILVTGGAGFIGANFVHARIAAQPEDVITVLDALTYAGTRESLPQESQRFRFVHGDITDSAAVAHAAEGAELIVHFAAESHVDRSISGPEAFLRTNVMGTFTLLEHARRNHLRFHHVSTDEVFGSLGPSDPPFCEETPYAPNSPYAASKAASDHLVRAYVHTYKLHATLSNCSNNYGPFHFPEKFIPLCLTNSLTGRPLPLYGDGLNVRDWIYVEDHCRGIDLVLSAGRSGESYNLGGESEWTNVDVLQEVCKLVDEAFARDPSLPSRFPDAPAARGVQTSTLITRVEDRPGHDYRYAMDIRKARTELGYEPAVAFEEGLARTVAWFLDHEEWWKPLLDRNRAPRMPR